MNKYLIILNIIGLVSCNNRNISKEILSCGKACNHTGSKMASYSTYNGCICFISKKFYIERI